MFHLMAIFAFIKVIIAFMLKWGFKVMAIGFLSYLFLTAGYKSLVQHNPDPLVKEFGGRIMLVDRTVEAEINKLRTEGMGMQDRLLIFFGIILDIFMFVYIIKFLKWMFAGMMGEVVPGSIYLMFAILVMAFFEAFYARIWLGHWVIPFVGFFSIITSLFELMILPIVEWFKNFFHISDLPTVGDETLSWWDRIFT